MLSHRVKGIVFNFENLEEFYVPIEQVEVFNFTNIHTDLNFWGGPVVEMTVADEGFVMLKTVAETAAVSSFDILSGEKKFIVPSLFERLAIHRDCIGIDLVYEDGERFEIYLPWDDDGDEYTNRNISTFFQEDESLRGKGCFCIHIGRTKNLMKWYLQSEE